MVNVKFHSRHTQLNTCRTRFVSAFSFPFLAQLQYICRSQRYVSQNNVYDSVPKEESEKSKFVFYMSMYNVFMAPYNSRKIVEILLRAEVCKSVCLNFRSLQLPGNGFVERTLPFAIKRALQSRCFRKYEGEKNFASGNIFAIQVLYQILPLTTLF